MADICKLHCVSNCPLCKAAPPNEVIAPPSPQNEQPKVLTDPEARGIVSAADRYANACEALKNSNDELKRVKQELLTVTEKYTKALEDKRTAREELAKSLKEDV